MTFREYLALFKQASRISSPMLLQAARCVFCSRVRLLTTPVMVNPHHRHDWTLESPRQVSLSLSMRLLPKRCNQEGRTRPECGGYCPMGPRHRLHRMGDGGRHLSTNVYLPLLPGMLMTSGLAFSWLPLEPLRLLSLSQCDGLHTNYELK